MESPIKTKKKYTEMDLVWDFLILIQVFKQKFIDKSNIPEKSEILRICKELIKKLSEKVELYHKQGISFNNNGIK